MYPVTFPVISKKNTDRPPNSQESDMHKGSQICRSMSYHVGRGNCQYALNIPTCFCWICQVCKAMTRPLPGTVLAVNNLKRRGNVSPWKRVGWLSCTIKVVECLSSIFFFYNAPHCVQIPIMDFLCHLQRIHKYGYQIQQTKVSLSYAMYGTI